MGDHVIQCISASLSVGAWTTSECGALGTVVAICFLLINLLLDTEANFVYTIYFKKR